MTVQCRTNLALWREGRGGEKYSGRICFFQAREKTTSPYTFGAQHTQCFEQINNESELEQAEGNKWFGAGRSGWKRTNKNLYLH